MLFKESQKFRQWWLWVILLGMDALFLFAVARQVIGGHPFGDKPASNAELLIVTGVLLLFTSLMLSLRLDTIIKEDGIYVRFFPLQWRFKHYPWDSLIKCFVRSYSPLTEYGGWGLRFGPGGKGWAFNISGNKGMQLQFTNHKKILIGTNRPDEITKALNKIGQLKQ